jgi:hypothetical protein
MNHTDEEAQRRMQTLSGFDPTTLPGQRETPEQEALRLRAENAALAAQLAAAEKALDAETEFKYRQTAELVNLEGERDLLRTSLAAATGRLGEVETVLDRHIFSCCDCGGTGEIRSVNAAGEVRVVDRCEQCADLRAALASLEKETP